MQTTSWNLSQLEPRALRQVAMQKASQKASSSGYSACAFLQQDLRQLGISFSAVLRSVLGSAALWYQFVHHWLVYLMDECVCFQCVCLSNRMGFACLPQ